MQADNIILRGDLNLSIGNVESWGHDTNIDALSDSISLLLDENHLIDIPMAQQLPIQWNRRVGDVSLARRLDWFLLKEGLIESVS